jgi:hypothetical protein
MNGDQKSLKPIKRPVALIVEGNDYFRTLLSQIDGPQEFDQVQLWNYSEHGNLERFIALLKTLRCFDTVRAIGVIRDCEESREIASNSVRRSFTNNQLQPPDSPGVRRDGTRALGYLLMPHDQDSGCLENALLSAATPELRIQCADEFLTCVNDPERNDNWRAKVRVHSLIAAADNPAWTIGESARAGLWNFSHESLHIMLKFIRDLIRLGLG